MSCPHCVASVKKALEEIAGISEVEVNLEKNEATYIGGVSKNIVKRLLPGLGLKWFHKLPKKKTVLQISTQPLIVIFFYNRH